jgi:nucleoside-diphosphate-sugar epimerase|tara:strand:- start:1282 stop:2217 length:936 start_codon:yes stop_codon:yes gene_type:complete
MEKILITGGAGYIGSMLCTKLLSLGHKVTVVDLLKYEKNSLSHLFYHKNFQFIKDDVTKTSVVKRIIKKQNIIIPLAALVGAPLCAKNKKQTIKTNVTSIEIILKYIKSSQKLIYPTTNSGYGIGQKDKFCDENSPLNPISLYGTTKLQAEKLIMTHKNSVAFRLATVFGFSYRMRTDLLVNNFVERAVKTKKLDIFEPHFRRNYVHIIDVVDAFVFAIQNFKKVKGNVFNLGLSSANLSKLMLAKKIKENYKAVKIEIIKNKSDPDKRDYFVSNKKIEKAGFKPSVSLDQGIKELVTLFSNVDVKFINNY